MLTTHIRLQQSCKYWNRRMWPVRLITLPIVSSAGSSIFITRWINLGKNHLDQIGVADSWFTFTEEKQHILASLLLEHHQRYLTKEGFRRSVTARNQWLNNWWDMCGSWNAWARGWPLTKQEKSINKQTKFR